MVPLISVSCDYSDVNVRTKYPQEATAGQDSAMKLRTYSRNLFFITEHGKVTERSLSSRRLFC